MGYYIRILGTQDSVVTIDQLVSNLNAAGLVAQFDLVDGEQADQWTIVDVANAKGETLAQIERNPVLEGELGKDELDEFVESIQDEQPASAVIWLLEYFKKVEVIYAFQMLNAAFEDENFEIISRIKSKIWTVVGGILQADGEGFSNEDGYHILWQFSDKVTGEWCCAVQDKLGHWNRFKMDLGDPQEREEFKNGEMPKKSVPLS